MLKYGKVKTTSLIALDLSPFAASLAKPKLDEEYNEKYNELITGKNEKGEPLPNLNKDGMPRFYNVELEKFLLKNTQVRIKNELQESLLVEKAKRETDVISKLVSCQYYKVVNILYLCRRI